ncbi:MAG: ankyrin repeat domain-containing protein [Betaproteobacteria bacterium AqS2]|uniref:Ankyrin repeat domain-containing protein n=1 Tax=Candidatus Amphirhobacter heronislandensis TaxID=1732024 RepID=A0A930Y2D1_9GAMM|nr:ankyrin repeat domain-containing protein [Betaproteobacteria bacterium AqS2]
MKTLLLAGLALGLGAAAAAQDAAAPADEAEAVLKNCHWKECFGVNWRKPKLSDLRRLDPDALSVEGRTPLHYAILNCAPGVAVETLGERGADFNLRDPVTGLTPLQTALTLCGKAAVDQVLEFGGDVNVAEDKVGGNTLHYAMARNLPDSVLKELIDWGANPDERSKDGTLPLIYYLALEDMEMFNYLVDAGANPNVFDAAGVGPVHIAAKRDDLEMLRRLRDAGAYLGAPTNQGKTPLHILAAAGALSADHIALFRLAAGIDASHRDEDGLAPLHYAAAHASAEGVLGMLLLGVSPNLQDERGNTPLHYALRYNADPMVARELLKVKSDPNFPDALGDKPLEIAILREEGSWELVGHLLDYGATPNLVDEDGRTLLHQAILAGNSEIGRKLLDDGANPRIKDAAGYDAFALVERVNLGGPLRQALNEIIAAEERAREAERERRAAERERIIAENERREAERLRRIEENERAANQISSVRNGELRIGRIDKRLAHLGKALEGYRKARNERKAREYEIEIANLESERAYIAEQIAKLGGSQ